MEIFKQNVYFTKWGEIYLGLKQQWITPQNVFDYCSNSNVQCCNEDRLVNLYLAFDESLYVYYEQIKDFIEEDREPLGVDGLHSQFLEYIENQITVMSSGN